MPEVPSGAPLTVSDGAVIHLQRGAALLVAPGASIGPEAGRIAKAIEDVPTGENASAEANAAAINRILLALRRAGIVASN